MVLIGWPQWYSWMDNGKDFSGMTHSNHATLTVSLVVLHNALSISTPWRHSGTSDHKIIWTQVERLLATLAKHNQVGCYQMTMINLSHSVMMMYACYSCFKILEFPSTSVVTIASSMCKWMACAGPMFEANREALVFCKGKPCKFTRVPAFTRVGGWGGNTGFGTNMHL